MRRARAALATAVLLIAAVPLPAAARNDPGLAVLQQRDQRLFALGWKLAVANAPFCARAAPAPGFQILDAGGFGNPAQVRAQLRLSGDIAVGALAPGSPAARAGLAVGDTILALGGEVLAARFPPSRPRYQRLIDVTAALDAAAARGPMVLSVARGSDAPRVVAIAGTPACPTRFEVLDKGKAAFSEGTRVVFGRDNTLFRESDAQFSVGIAHELAHNLLGHNRALTEHGRSLGNQRLAEREADRLSAWLIANAGYDPENAARFTESWLRANDGGLLRNRDHEGWDERAAAIRAELPLIRAVMAREGKADWARHFKRETLSQRR